MKPILRKPSLSWLVSYFKRTWRGQKTNMILGDNERKQLGIIGVNEALTRAFADRFNLPTHWVHIERVYRDMFAEGLVRFTFTAIEAVVMNGQARLHTFRVPDGETFLPLGSQSQADLVRSLADL